MFHNQIIILPRQNCLEQLSTMFVTCEACCGKNRSVECRILTAEGDCKSS
jgi:hypothetical protein